MYLGRVIGTCVASRKYQGLEGVKLLVVQPLGRDRKPKGEPQIACDVAKAGPDDFVFLVGSREASHALEEAFVPVDAAIVGIVDDLDQVNAQPPRGQKK
jgi:ethanolamine utilization protein EutN